MNFLYALNNPKKMDTTDTTDAQSSQRNCVEELIKSFIYCNSLLCVRRAAFVDFVTHKNEHKGRNGSLKTPGNFTEEFRTLKCATQQKLIVVLSLVTK